MSDIRWSHLNKRDLFSFYRKLVLIILIIVVLLLVVTPATVRFYFNVTSIVFNDSITSGLKYRG